MDRLAVSTVVHRPPEDVYDFLLEFSRYPRYSRYLKSVERHDVRSPDTTPRGDGGTPFDAGDDGDPGGAGTASPPTDPDADAKTAESGAGTTTATQSGLDLDLGRAPGPSSETDPAPRTEYDLRLAWWKLGCSMRSRVVEAVRPERIDWRIVEGPEAAGRWQVSAAPAVAERECVPAASRVRLEAEFDPHSCDGAVSLPDFLGLDRAIAQVKPLLVREIERMVVRAVRDLEGEARDVTITVEEEPAVDLV